MSNINWNQFSNNYLNNYNGIKSSNISNTPLTQNAMPIQEQKTPIETLLPKYIAQFEQTSTELEMLNQQQTIKMLKDLLQLPKNFEKFLTQLAVNPQESNVKTALLLLASNVDLGKLSSLLQNNSKLAMTNLYQMLAQFNQLGMSLKDEQLSELTKLISFVSASSSSDVQSLKTTMLMYLPWLPLTDPNVFKLEIGNPEENSALGDDDSVTILIQTENYGNLKSNIYKTDKDGIKIEIISSETFPQNDFEYLMKEESKKYNININFEFGKKSIFNKKKNEQSQTQIYMNTSPGVNPFLLMMSNSVIKNVHIIDSRENLREQRKEKIKYGKAKN